VREITLCLLLGKKWVTTLESIREESGLVFFSPGTASSFQSAVLNAYPVCSKGGSER